MADWYEPQKVVHFVGSPSNRGKEIFRSFTLNSRVGRLMVPSVVLGCVSNVGRSVGRAGSVEFLGVTRAGGLVGICSTGCAV